MSYLQMNKQQEYELEIDHFIEYSKISLPDSLFDLIEERSVNNLLKDIKEHDWDINVQEELVDTILDWIENAQAGLVISYVINKDNKLEYVGETK